MHSGNIRITHLYHIAINTKAKQTPRGWKTVNLVPIVSQPSPKMLLLGERKVEELCKSKKATRCDNQCNLLVLAPLLQDRVLRKTETRD